MPLLDFACAHIDISEMTAHENEERVKGKRRTTTAENKKRKRRRRKKVLSNSGAQLPSARLAINELRRKEWNGIGETKRRVRARRQQWCCRCRREISRKQNITLLCALYRRKAYIAFRATL